MNAIRKWLVMLCAFFPLWAYAVGEPYTQEKLDALNKAGKPTLVLIHADWCSTCRAQDRILTELLPTNEFKNITALRVDFDTQKPVVRAFGVNYQSTLIAFKNGKEVGRTTAETDSGRIAELLRKTL